MKSKRGITLIALVITIVVLLILAGISISMLTGDNGIITNSQKSKTSSELSKYKEELRLYKTQKKIENGEFDEKSLTAGKINLMYNTKPDNEEGNIKTIITTISDEYYNKLEIIKGKLLIKTKNKNEIKIAQSLEIEVNPYDITEDGELLSSNGNLLLMDEKGSLTIPDSVTKIGEGAFANLEGLKTIIIPGTVKKIERNAFSHNSTLETVIMQEGVEEIGALAFEQCSKLKNVQLPQTLKELGSQSFYADRLIEKIVIPSGVKTISSYCFGSCSGIKEIVLSEGVEKISSSAFVYTTFSSITIPESVTEITTGAFNKNKNLNTIIVKGENPNYIYDNGFLMDKGKTNIIYISDSYLKNITEFRIPSNIKTFNVSLTSYENITKLIIPKETTSINSDYLPATISEIVVESGNTTLEVSSTKKILYDKIKHNIICCFSKEETINLKDENNELGILEIATYSFKQADKAKYITLPDSLEKIGSFAFNSGCKNIIELKIGAKVSDISPLFKYMNFAGSVIIDNENPNYIVSNDVLYNKDKSELCVVLKGISGEFRVDNSVTKIGNYAFHNQRGLTSIILPEGLQVINNSFNYCSGLTYIDIPNSVIEINSRCFSESENLEKININKKENQIKSAPWGAVKGNKVVNWKK